MKCTIADGLTFMRQLNLKVVSRRRDTAAKSDSEIAVPTSGATLV